MSDDDVLQALQVLKRHGKLDDDFFFHTVVCPDRSFCVFLPDICMVSPDRIKAHYRVNFTARVGGGSAHAAFDLHFTTEEEFKQFFLKWKQAKLARLLY